MNDECRALASGVKRAASSVHKVTPTEQQRGGWQRPLDRMTAGD